MVTAQATLQAAPKSESGIWSWITTVDHKRIGLMYGVTALFFMLVGGAEALLIRVQLARPDNDFVSAEFFNQLFTMHGTTMIFLVGMPIAVGFFNYVMPLQIGARDVAFPRLNALSYWIYLFGAIYINTSFLFNAAPNGGWFGYAPLTGSEYSPGLNADFWVIGLQILGVSSIMGGINFITTILNLRAPGMKMMRLPPFTWMTMVTSFLIITALPVLAVALFLVTFDRFFGTNFFVASAGGDAVLYQHLFWIFGHPEVYILILPAFGIISEVIPTFSRKPLFGYSLVIYSGILIALVGWGVWAHHMFGVGMGPIADSFFAITSLIVAIPTGVKIFNWLATMWGGSIQFKMPMMWAIAFLVLFTLGGVSGVHHGVAPADLQQTDTYYVIAHFHYVLFGGLIMGIFAGLYYWFPKATGRFLDEKIGRWHFWLVVIGMNLTFFPMHFAGLLGMPRRIFTYSSDLNLGDLNMIITVGGFLTGIGILVFIWNVVKSLKSPATAGPNPWGSSALEWASASPPVEHNFNNIPVVHSREVLWDESDAVMEQTLGEVKKPIHMPNSSYWPIFTALGVVGASALLMTGHWWAPLIGFAWIALGILNWNHEPAFPE
jgi:cytochrome c oxidase subunit 1